MFRSEYAYDFFPGGLSVIHHFGSDIYHTGIAVIMGEYIVDLLDAGILEEQFLECIVKGGEFGDGSSAAVDAVRVDLSEQAYGDHAEEGAGELVGFDAHIEHSYDSAAGRAGVHGGNEPVSGHSGLNGDGGGMFIANFTEREDLRVLSHNASQGVFVGKFTEWCDLNLCNAGQVAFDGVFEADDAESGVGFGDGHEQSVDGGGFTGSSRPGKQ